MDETNRGQDIQDQDWRQTDPRVLGQILAAQNILFVLPDESRIAEYFSKALSGVPGVTSCLVCLGGPPAPAGAPDEVCGECSALRPREGAAPVLPRDFSCGLAAKHDMRVITLKTNEQTLGYFIFRTDSNPAFEPYWPFLNNLANYLALSLENRMQKRLLEKSRDEMEERVRERTGELKRMNERFSLAANAARLGVWDWDIQKNELVWDGAMYELYGVKREDFAGAYEAWLKGVHPDDRALSDEISRQARNGEREYDTEFRVVWPDGSIHYLKAYGQLVRDADGRPLRMTGVNYDITENKRAQESLKDQHSTLRGIIDSANALIFSVDRRYRYTSFNQGHAAVMKTIYGADIEIGRSLLEYMTVTEDREKARSNIDRARAGEQIVEEAYSGEEVRSRQYFQVSHCPIRSENGEIIGVAALAHDITERKRAEESLRESEKRYHLLLDSVTDYIYTVTIKEGRPVSTVHGPGCVKVTGYSSEEYEADPGLWFRMVYEPDRQTVKEQAARALSGEQTLPLEHCIHHRDGTIRWVRNTIVPRYDLHGRLIAYDGLIEDISERKRMEETVRDSEERYRKAQAIGHVGSWEYNIQTTRFWGSDEAKRIYGFEVDADTFTTDEVENCIPERARVHQALIDLLEHDKEYNLEFDIITHDTKSRKTITSIADLERDEAGRPLKITGIIHDITERKRAEEDISLLSFSLNTVREAAFLIDESARFHYVNEEACRVLGYTRAELLGLGVPDVDPDFPAERWPRHWDELKTRRSLGFEGLHRAKNGRVFPVEINANFLEYKGKTYDLALVRDITERKQAEKTIKESEQRYRGIFDNVLDSLFLLEITDDGRFRNLEMNPAFEKSTGMSRAQLIGRLIEETVPGEVAAVVNAKYRHCVEAGHPIEEEAQLDLPSGRRYFHSTLIPVRDETGEICRIIGISRDITDKKLAEEEIYRLNAELEQRVKERTNELAGKNRELERMNKVFVGRELRMIELKKRIKEMQKEKM